MEHTAVKEAIQAQSQLASSVQSTGRLKRKKASAYEKGRKIPICIYCHRVVSVRGKSSENATSKVCFTIPEEEEVEEEIPLRNVKAQTAKDDLVGHIHEDDLTPREKGLLRSVKEADLLLEGLFSHIHEDDLTPTEKGMLKSVKEDLRDVFHFLSTFVGTKNLKMMKASAYEKGRKKPICIYCHRFISVRGKSSENATSKVCFTIPEEEEVEEEIPLRNVKAQTAKDDLVGHVHEDDLTPREKGLLRSVKEPDLLVEGLFSHIHEDDLTPTEKGMLKSLKEDLRDVFHTLSTFVGTKNLKMIP